LNLCKRLAHVNNFYTSLTLAEMPDIKITPLGAGQDVGRSCILVSMGGKNIMLDCGMHMGFNDERRFPDFSYIVPEGPATNHIDCVIISHFHLDHCGALPYFTEMVTWCLIIETFAREFLFHSFEYRICS